MEASTASRPRRRRRQTATAPYGFRAIGRIGGEAARRRRWRMRGSGGRILQSSSTVPPRAAGERGAGRHARGGLPPLARAGGLPRWSRAKALLAVLELELGPAPADLRGHGGVDLARTGGLPTTTARKAKQDASFWRRGGDLPACSVGKGGGAREGKNWRGKVEACGIRRATTIGDDAFYSASSRVDSASGNGTEASPPEATRGPSVGERGGLFAKIPFYRRLIRTRCTCPNTFSNPYCRLF
jgi:hypothetical protein